MTAAGVTPPAVTSWTHRRASNGSPRPPARLPPDHLRRRERATAVKSLGVTLHARRLNPAVRHSTAGIRTDLDLRLRAELEQLGVAVNTAAQLVQQFPPERIRAALAAARAARPRSPAGWVIAAIRQGWTLPKPTATADRTAPAPRTEITHAPDPPPAYIWERWDLALSALLSDADLRTLAITFCPPVPGVGWMIPAVRVEIIRWANYQAVVADSFSVHCFREAMREIRQPPPEWEPVAPPPLLSQRPEAVGLKERLTEALNSRK